MSKKILFHLTMFLSICAAGYGQYHEDLLKIIDLPEALEIKQQKIDSFFGANTSKLSPMILADCYHDLGLKWYFQNWRTSGNTSALQKAIKSTQKALLIKRKLDSLESCSLNKTLYNLSLFYSKNNNIYDAIDIYLELIRKGNEYCENKAKNKIQFSRRSLGNLYMLIGDFYKALETFKNLILAYKSQESLDEDDQEILIYAYIKIAEIYSLIDTEQYSEKIKVNLEIADSYLKESSIACCEFENLINQLEGNRLLRTEKYSKALNFHKEVIKRLPVNPPVNFAIVYNSLAISYLMEKEYELSYENLQNAISYDRFYSETYENLGNLHIAQGALKKALVSYQKAINYSTDQNLAFGFDELPTIKNLEVSPEKIPLLNHLVTKANGWIKYYEQDNNKEHLTHALKTFTLADQLVDLIRFESTEFQSKLFWREQGASLYMKAIEVCHLLNMPEEAFHFMERNKALLLLEDLTNEEAKEISDLPQELAQREFNLKRKIHLSENNLQETDDTSQEIMAHLKDTIRENKYRYEQFVDSLNESYPDYAKFKKKVEILAFKDLKTNYVSGNSAVLHYILNEEQGYGLLTLSDTTLLFQIEDIPELNKNVETLIATLSSGVSDMGMFRKVSNSVFGQLIPETIYGKIKGKQLLIIPDYTLQRIPFEALVVNMAEPKYLIEDVEISYAYSMSLLDHTMGKEKDPPNDLVAFAPVQFDSMGLPKLHFSENEVTGIAEVYPGKTFLNGRASKSNFIENIGQHKIVHLATHADVGDGENPWIAFSDSKIYLKEIYATRNQADMVVLSACNTSNGELKRGEGVMSLARGFFYSGAKSVVSTLWPVADEAGKDILIGFYENLDRGDSKSEALQKAKLAYMRTTEEEELKHPYYWAGFIVVGDNAPVVTKSYWYWVLLVMGLLVLVFLLFRGKLFKGIQ